MYKMTEKEQLIQIENWEKVQRVIEQAKFVHPKHGNVVIFTNANEWYIPTLIKNLHKSMQIHEPAHNLLVLCSDPEGYEMCKHLGYEHYAYLDIPLLGVKEYRNLNGGGDIYTKYTKLCYVKTVIMRHMLENGYTPLYIDPDMALRKPSIENLLGYLGRGEVVVAGSPQHINTNIMIAKPTSTKCIQMYQLTVERVQETLHLRLPSGDEPYTSTRILFIHKIPFVCVETHEHPGGKDLAKYQDSYTVHANCTSGLDNKIGLLKSCQCWYLPKVCIATLAIGEEFQQRYKQLFEPSHARYAQRYNYDRRVITEFLDVNCRDFRAVTFQKALVASQDWCSDYDYIVVLDGDVVVNKCSPPIEYNCEFGDRIGVVSEFATDVESGFVFRHHVPCETAKKYYKRSIGVDYDTEHLINTGVLVIQPKKHSEFLKNIYYKYLPRLMEQPNDFYNYEQAVIGYELMRNDMCIFMSHSWNAIWWFAKHHTRISMQEYLQTVYFLHLAGCCDHYEVAKLDN